MVDKNYLIENYDSFFKEFDLKKLNNSNDFFLLKVRYLKNEKNKLLGLIPHNEYQLEFNNIFYSTIQLIDSYEWENEVSKSDELTNETFFIISHRDMGGTYLQEIIDILSKNRINFHANTLSKSNWENIKGILEYCNRKNFTPLLIVDEKILISCQNSKVLPSSENNPLTQLNCIHINVNYFDVLYSRIFLTDNYFKMGGEKIEETDLVKYLNTNKKIEHSYISKEFLDLLDFPITESTINIYSQFKFTGKEVSQYWQRELILDLNKDKYKQISDVTI